MKTYQPWTINLLSMMQHNAGSLLWLTQRLSYQYHSQSDYTCVTAVTLCFALAQLLDQAGQLLHLLGWTMFPRVLFIIMF